MIELSMAMAITAMLSFILGGLALAIQTGHEHAAGFEDATQQAQATLDRMDFMISHAGVYQLAGEPPVAGIATVAHRWAVFDLPDVLVVWSGGRSGGMAEAGVRTRLPRANEIVVFAADSTDAGRLLEYTFPSSTAEVDFRSNQFRTQVLTLLASSQAESILLCDRVRRSDMPQIGIFSGTTAPNVRFDLTLTPSDAQLTSTTPGTAAWNALPWAQGIVASDMGLRQATVRIELMLEPRDRTPAGTQSVAIALPFFGSATHRHAYRR